MLKGDESVLAPGYARYFPGQGDAGLIRPLSARHRPRVAGLKGTRARLQRGSPRRVQGHAVPPFRGAPGRGADFHGDGGHEMHDFAQAKGVEPALPRVAEANLGFHSFLTRIGTPESTAQSGQIDWFGHTRASPPARVGLAGWPARWQIGFNDGLEPVSSSRTTAGQG